MHLGTQGRLAGLEHTVCVPGVLGVRAAYGGRGVAPEAGQHSDHDRSYKGQDIFFFFFFCSLFFFFNVFFCFLF